MGFFPIDRDVFSSSIWLTGTAEERVLWIFLIGRADPDGVVRLRELAIADGAKLSRDTVRDGLEKFAQPDPDSRTQAHEGRRIELTDDGFPRLLNFELYQSRDYSTPRWRRWRDRQKAKASGGKRQRKRSNALANGPTPLPTTDTDTDTDTETTYRTRVSRSDGTDRPSTSQPKRSPMTEATASAIEAAAELLQRRYPRGRTAREWIQEYSRIDDNDPRGPQSFDDPRRPGLSAAWGKACLERLEVAIAADDESRARLGAFTDAADARPNL